MPSLRCPDCARQSKAEHIEVKPDRRTGAFEIRKRVRSEQHFRLHCAHDAVAAAFRAANEL